MVEAGGIPSALCWSDCGVSVCARVYTHSSPISTGWLREVKSLCEVSRGCGGQE